MSSKLNSGVNCYVHMRDGTIWGKRTELKADTV